MTRQIVYKATFFLLAVLFAVVATAQSGIIVRAVADRNKILIGEQFDLTLTADIPENEAISFFSIDSLPHFEFVEKQKIDTVNTSSGTILTQIIRITSFDSGHWVIPSFSLTENIATDSLPVDVGFSEFDPNQNYHDIKDIIDVKVEKKKKWWLYPVGAAGLILLLVLIYLLTKKKKQVVKPAELLIDPYAEAMKQIDKLQNDKPGPKQYYSAMVDIFRQYVLRKKGVRSLQETTDDLVLQLKNLDISRDNFNRLVLALRLSDFVKFAKYHPAPEDDAALLHAIKQSIQEIEQVN